jgi:hypothetical protein
LPGRESRWTSVTAGSREERVKRAIVIIALVAAPVFADEVYLRGGGRFSGEIVEQTEDSVTVDIGGGYLTAPMSTVVRIEEGVSPLAEYRERAAGIPPGDAEAWRELARWATSKTLSSQSWEAYSQVVAILPDDDEANRALGRVLLNGKWVTEDESYRARGYIEFENQWMTPAERKAILAERQAQEQADRQANEAEIRAIQADIDAEQQREDEEFERQTSRFDRLQDYGEPVDWGWGGGPAYWPSPVVYTQPVELGAAPVGGR